MRRAHAVSIFFAFLYVFVLRLYHSPWEGTAQKMKFSIKDSISVENYRFGHIYSKDKKFLGINIVNSIAYIYRN